MKEIIADTRLIAACGLYCGGCGAYLKGKCPGCSGNDRASWCKVRTCCLEKKVKSCADCPTDVKKCGYYTNFISKAVGFFLRSDRSACIARIKQIGYPAFAGEMAAAKTARIKPGRDRA
ncbi:MAG: DUF3795 domain-containing protein [Elusimicrobiaceae bacterium]|jgi:hypothetical protein